MVKVTIDHKEYEFPEGLNLIEACQSVGIQIPHFCYHPKLEVAGNCRMCLVDVEGGRKPVPSCATHVQNGMVVHTTTTAVKRDRQGVMEFLLINHPLDCPICDQAGECDLQDEALHYGRDRSRYTEDKRRVENKHISPLISTIMTRCIHCTRCIRFAEDIAGVEVLGAIGRGMHTEITTYLSEAVNSELSGNLPDICPVGALNAKPYQFHGRPWELTHTDSIDVLDGLGSNIRIDSRGGEVLRIKPRHNDAINEIWLSDKSRFACDGLLIQRLDTPYVRINGRLAKTSWDDAYFEISKVLKSKTCSARVGGLADVESTYLLMKLLGNSESISGGFVKHPNPAYVFNSTLEGIEKADVCILIGCNPKMEAPVLNVRLRRNVMKQSMKMFRVGLEEELTYPVTELGSDIKDISKIEEILKDAKHPAIIMGEAILKSDQSEEILAYLSKLSLITEDWNGFNILHTKASSVALLNFEISSIQKPSEVVVLLGDDESDVDPSAFVIYIGHHGGKGAMRADVILPSAAYTEKTAWYVNTEGRLQSTQQAVPPVGLAKEDWVILKELLGTLKIKHTFTNLNSIRNSILEEFPVFKEKKVFLPTKRAEKPVTSEQIQQNFNNFYYTDIISQNSKTMALCVRDLLKKGNEA